MTAPLSREQIEDRLRPHYGHTTELIPREVQIMLQEEREACAEILTIWEKAAIEQFDKNSYALVRSTILARGNRPISQSPP
jgi:hypothetical protein